MIAKRIVIIGIQARSTSDRLPGKIHKIVGTKPILQWVIDACNEAVNYLQRETDRLGFKVRVCLLIPDGDGAKNIYQVDTITGNENDVLSRYVAAQKKYEADYVVRVTGDCVLLPAHLVAKHVKSALIREADYTSNVIHRTFKEGFDVEVISKRLLNYLDANAKTKEHREHVTTLIRSGPFPFKKNFLIWGVEQTLPSVCHILNDYDDSRIKTSIDTQEELNLARIAHEAFLGVLMAARASGVTVQ